MGSLYGESAPRFDAVAALLDDVEGRIPHPLAYQILRRPPALPVNDGCTTTGAWDNAVKTFEDTR